MPDLLPPNATKQERDISLAIDRLPDVPIKTLWTPATCPEAHLPWLAWALSVDEWDAAWPTETKRSVIAESIEQHRKKGTVGALRRALQRLGYEVEIDERTGTAYTFRLRFKVREGESAGGAVVESAIAKATQVALRQKNARSELIGTDLIAETDPVKMYVGGVSVSGAETQISPPPPVTSLPLDSHKTEMFASFWTVKMQSNYSGFIGRVKRASDGKSMNYKNTRDLRQFVQGSDWFFTRLYNQNGTGAAVAYGNPPEGEFDSNGLPRMKNDDISSSPLRLLTYLFASRSFPNISLASAFQHLTLGTDEQDAYVGLQIPDLDASGFADREIYMNLRNETAGILYNIEPIGGGYALNVTGKQGGSAVSRVNSSNSFIHYGGAMEDTGTYDEVPVFTQFIIQPGYNLDPIYGASIWTRDIGSTAAAAINTAIEAHLDL
jgi:phage tail P2-like protein